MNQRLIKFCAWDTNARKMYSAEEMGRDELQINPDGRGFFNASATDQRLSSYYPHLLPLQFTGLPSKDGKDIYEGDIVKYGKPYHGEITTILIGFITYNEHCGAFQIAYKNIYNSFVTDFAHLFTIVERIGNIHEHPNLI